MTYSVEWLPDAEDELAAIWLNADDRPAVTFAANTIDRLLQTNPDAQGESRPNGRRILFCKPLGVLFRVFAQQRRVQVQHVWSF
jgi:hypothetical protein